jgi:N-acetylmuramoyl-L-alanine amidase
MLFLLDNGHGAMVSSEYQTPGKRSPIWTDGSQIFEGEFNRSAVNRIVKVQTHLNIPYVNVVLAPNPKCKP